MIAPFLWSGAGGVIVRMLQDFKRSGLECEIVSSGQSRGLEDWPEYVRLIHKNGIPYHTIDFFNRDPAVLQQGIERLAALLTKRRYDLIHVHSGVPAHAAAVCRDRLNLAIPIIATFHSWNPNRPSWMNQDDIRALNRCDRVFTVSQSYKKELESWGLSSDLSATICFGVDIHPRKKPALDDTFRILCVGRIEPRKDQETILRGFSIFHNQYPETELCVVGPAGDRAYADYLTAAANRRGWNKGVRFPGKVQDPDTWYEKADLFVSASRDEGLGLSVLEAMAHGLPVICTDVNGHAEFAEDNENALLYPPGNPALLAGSIKKMYLDPSLRNRLSTKAHATIQQAFTWTRTMEKYWDIYGSLLKNSECANVKTEAMLGSATSPYSKNLNPLKQRVPYP